ncbi:Sel1 repeat-containing protein [Amphritea atlantica]|uniref:Sel1 repeat-containing protein n=1 Tax=Amphritea atlantica TaxID=355243 RepID=A0A1H9KRW9_9GAMM|nr:tetratricopeptide repeat protein [Amphritea atlantica]SER01900.1 Sel1 repeat-containing protein [Amphritea atlantica]
MLKGLRLTIAAVITLLGSGVYASQMQQCQQAYSEGKVMQAYHSCLPLAQVGDPQAAFILARLYALGVESGTPDWQKVVEWLTISAAGDHAEAAYNLAIAYQKGKGTEIDLQQSINYYTQSAELGNAKAMRNLALLYEKGEGVPQDIHQAFTLYQRSAEAGLSDSQLKTGLMLLQGEGVAKDPAAARPWIEQSAAAGNDKAQLALGVLLIDFDPGSAIEWYRQAVYSGNAYAAHNLALIYSQGRVVPQDLLQALAYADASIELGNPKTQVLYDKILAAMQQAGTAVSRPRNNRISLNHSDQSTGQAEAERADTPGPASAVQADAEPSLRDINWLKAQPAGLFVVQLARLTSLESSIRFISDYHIPRIAHTVNLAKHDYVVLLKESFVSKADALRTLKQRLPGALASEAWIRSYRSLYAQ